MRLVGSFVRLPCRWWKTPAVSLVCTGFFLCSSNPAKGQLNGGVELGAAMRTGHPELNAGLAYGAYLEAKPFKSIGLGAYYAGTHHSVNDLPSTEKDASFHAVGIRARYTMIIPRSRFLPYGFVGLGYVWASYPIELIDYSDRVIGPSTLRFQPRDGHFWELPVGIGLGYRAMDALVFTLDASLRPSFGFGGSAFDRDSYIDETTIGAATMLGISFDL